jgi:hypothetical protein
VQELILTHVISEARAVTKNMRVVVAVRSMARISSGPLKGHSHYKPVRMSQFGLLSSHSSTSHLHRIFKRRHDLCKTVLGKIVEVKPEFNDCYSEFIEISNILCEILHKDDLASVFNGSVRHCCSLLSDFISFLHDIEDHHSKHLERVVGGAATGSDYYDQLFSWLAQQKDPKEIAGPIKTLKMLLLGGDSDRFDFDLPYVIEIDPGNAATFSAAASVDHLLISCIYNLTTNDHRLDGHRTSTRGRCTLGQIYNLMAKSEGNLSLGFTKKEIANAIKDRLHAHPGAPLRPIDVIDFDPLSDDIEDRTGMELCLMPLGEIYLGKIFTTVGFVWGNLSRAFIPKEGEAIVSQGYFHLSRQEQLDKLYNYLIKQVKQHLKLLCLLRQTYRYDSWEDWYRRHFAVDGKFQVERMLDEASRFYQSSFPSDDENKFRTLRKRYADVLEIMTDDLIKNDMTIGLIDPAVETKDLVKWKENQL